MHRNERGDAWARIKGEQKAHVRNPKEAEGDMVFPTGCARYYPTNRIAETFETRPPIKARCRGCDAWATQHPRLAGT